jgi:hypothetical protein
MSESRRPPRGVASSINPAAGLHEITADDAELRACARAATRSWEYFPYYGRRYGAEGWRFGFSDSAWLATLCDRDPAEAVEQIHWLGSVLSSRGMPQIMLEYHLRFQHEELLAEVPQRRDRWRILERCEHALAVTRQKAFTDSDFDALAESFESKAGREELDRVGVLLVSAVADETAGIGNAVGSLTSFLTDPSRFSSRWINAVEAVLAAARSSGKA